MKNKKRQPCPICGQKKNDLDRHIRMAHSGQQTNPPAAPEPSAAPPAEEIPAAPAASMPKVAAKLTRRVKWLALFGGIGLFGLILFLVYLIGGNNYAAALIAIVSLFTGVLGFWYHWGKFDEIKTTYVGDVPKGQVNSLVIYPDRITFEDVKNAKGFTWSWDQDKNSIKYYLYWENPKTKAIEPYNLPDQQYCDPEVFGQKFLSLPCHRQWIATKDDIIQKLKPLFAALAGVAGWILILTTT